MLWILGHLGGSVWTDFGCVFNEVPSGNHHGYAERLRSRSGLRNKLEKIHQLSLLAGIFGTPLAGEFGWWGIGSGFRGLFRIHQAGVFEYGVIRVVIAMHEKKDAHRSFNAFPKIVRHRARHELGVEGLASEVRNIETNRGAACRLSYEELVGQRRLLAIRAIEYFAAKPLLFEGL